MNNDKYNTLIFAFVTGMSGAVLYIYEKLTIFHIGAILGLIALIRYYYSNQRDRDLIKKPLYEAMVLALIIVIQLLWVENIERWIYYFVYLSIGTLFYIISYFIASKSILKKWHFYLIVLIWVSITLINTYSISSPPQLRDPFGNINNLSAALIFLNLVYHLYFKKGNLIIITISSFFAVGLDRRASFLALFLYIIGDVFIDLKTKNISLLKTSFYALLVLISSVFITHYSRGLRLPSKHPSNYEVYSEGIRLSLLNQMHSAVLEMKSYEYVFGKGVGQLNLLTPRTNIPYASPHLFWAEMFLYVGVLWPFWLLVSFIKCDYLGKVSCIVVFVAGLSLSSMVYFIPLYITLGFIKRSILKEEREKVF